MRTITFQQKWEHIWSYYRHYILGAAAAAGLLCLLAFHLSQTGKKPEFTCVMVNQQIDDVRDRRIGEAFAAACGKPAERIVVDSGFNFSYDDVRLEGVNESSYEKFFFKWSVGELDAIVMPESFYRHCVKMGGTFLEPEGVRTLWLAEDGEPSGIPAADTVIASCIEEREGDPVVIVFPTDGEHHEMAKQFMKFLEK